MADDKLPALMTPKEAAEFLRMPVRTVTKLLNDGTIAGRKIGKSWRIPREVLVALALPLEAPQGSEKNQATLPME